MPWSQALGTEGKSYRPRTLGGDVRQVTTLLTPSGVNQANVRPPVGVLEGGRELEGLHLLLHASPQVPGLTGRFTGGETPSPHPPGGFLPASLRIYASQEEALQACVGRDCS